VGFGHADDRHPKYCSELRDQSYRMIQSGCKHHWPI